jgi:hypothetical protein
MVLLPTHTRDGLTAVGAQVHLLSLIGEACQHGRAAAVRSAALATSSLPRNSAVNEPVIGFTFWNEMTMTHREGQQPRDVSAPRRTGGAGEPSWV